METMMNEKSSWRIFSHGLWETIFFSDKNFRGRRLVLVFCFLFHPSFSVTKSAGKRIKEDCAHAFLFVQIVNRGIVNTISS